jgi:zinc/manganese transport system ATP-binding protein
VSAVRLVDLTVGYDRHPAVHHLTGTFAPGSLTAIVGPNGAGKTTLLKAVVGLLRPASGRVERQGLPRGAIAYLPQQAEVDRSFPINVRDVVLLGHWPRLGAFGAMGPAARRTAERALAEVGLEGFGRRAIGSLSQGQLQRVMCARILVQDARVILLDEPFAAVDAFTRLKLQQEFKTLLKLNRPTVLFVTHDVPEAIALGDVIVVMSQRPATVQRIIPVPREARDRASAAYARMLAGTLECLGVTSDMGAE